MLDSAWLKVLDCFQKKLVSSLVGGGMSSFENLATPERTRTTFDSGTVITANLTASAMSHNQHVVAAEGFVADQNGNVLGGVFTTLHGQTLAGSSPHYIVIEHATYRITIYQPSGDNGALSVPRPVDWTDENRIHATAVTITGSTINRSVTIQSDLLQVDYLDSISGEPVDRFVLSYCVPGDADCDGDTDLLDLAVFVDCMAGPSAALNPTPPRTVQECFDDFDADSDADVDSSDFAAFQRGFIGGY